MHVTGVFSNLTIDTLPATSPVLVERVRCPIAPIRPRCSLILGSISSRQFAFNHASVPSSSAPGIGGENGGQPAFDAFRGQSAAPNRMGRIDYRLSGRILTANATAAIPFQ
jgi:hypothetical protein